MSEKIEELNTELQIPITVVADFCQIDDDSVDVVISNHALEHVPEPFWTLNEIKRVLVHGGRIVLVTPFDDWRANRPACWRPHDPDNHLFTWSPQNIGNLLVEAGFKVLETRLCRTAWSPKIFWIHRLLGDRVFRIACYMLSRALHRAEVFSVAYKP